MEIGQRVETGRPAWVRAAAGRLAVVAVVLMLLGGCAQEQAYKRGERLSKAGQYEQAVAELEKAVGLAEDNHNRKTAEKYRRKLEQVKLEAGQFLYREAQLTFGRAELGEARGFIERGIKFCPQDQTYQAFRDRVLKAIDEAEQVRADALSLAEQRQWQDAVQRMNEALTMYRTMPGGSADLKRIKDRAYRYYVDLAKEKLNEDNLTEAESQAQNALIYQGSGREAKDVIQTVKDRREAAKLIEQGRGLLAQGNAGEALAALDRAARLHPLHPDLPGLLQQAREAVCDQWLGQGRATLAAHNYPAAMRLFQKSQDLLNGYGGVASLLTDARSRLAELHLEGSEQYLQADAAGIAAFHAAAAMSYLPDNFDTRRQLGQCMEQVRQDVAYTVAFAGVKAAPEQQPVAAILDAAAIEHLTQTHPANVMVVERSDLQAILGEQDLSATDRIDPQSRVPTGKLQGVDALIVGQMLESKVTSTSKQTGHGESVYQDGYRHEPNPDYIHATKVLDAAVGGLEVARKRLAEAEARLAHYRHVDPANPAEMARKRKAQADVDECKQRLVNAAAEVGTAKIRQAAIPPQVVVPNMVKHQYPIETFTWTAKVVCMIKMLDTATGEVLIAQRVEGRAEQSDRMVQADAFRNVPEDPLVLPSESTLLQAAANSATVGLRETLNQACAKHGERFLLTMQQAQAAGDMIQAVDNGIKYLFAYPTGGANDKAIIELLRRYLADEDGLIDVRATLRTYCHILQ